MGENPVTQIHPGPNEKCSCNSGKKFKKCCGSPKGVEPEPPLTPEEQARLEAYRSRRSTRAMARLAPILGLAAMAGPMAPPPRQTGYPGQSKYGGGKGR